MKTIIGLGRAGCKIAESFSQYPQYKIYKIDVGIEESKNCFNFPELGSIEEYESNCPSFKKFFRYVKGEVLFVTSCGYVSAASLKILEHLKNKCEINVLYIKPDPSLLPEIKSLNDNVLFGVLQQFARSALFKRIYLIDNLKMSEIVGDVPLRDHFNKINQLISSTIHMINVFRPANFRYEGYLTRGVDPGHMFRNFLNVKH